MQIVNLLYWGEYLLGVSNFVELSLDDLNLLFQGCVSYERGPVAHRGPKPKCQFFVSTKFT